MVENIVKLIDEEIAQLEHVKRMLTDAVQAVVPRRRGRPRKADVVLTASAVKSRRKLSIKARKAIANAQRKRWAAKKGATSAPAKTEKKASAKQS